MSVEGKAVVLEISSYTDSFLNDGGHMVKKYISKILIFIPLSWENSTTRYNSYSITELGLLSSIDRYC